MIVFSHNDQRQTLHGGEVETFVKRASAHAAVADVGQGHKLLLLHARAEQDTGHDRNHISQMRDWANKALFHVAEMDVEIFAARWSPRFCHVLREDFARANAFNKHGAKISDQRGDEVLGLKRVCSANCRRFLAQRAKHTADNLRLAIEIYEALFDETREFQVAIELEMLLEFERRLGRATQGLIVDGLARRVLRADTHLETWTHGAPASTG